MAQTQLDYALQIKKEETQQIKAENNLQNFINSLEIQQQTSGNTNQLDQNIFQDNKDILTKRATKKYSSTKVKARNLLTNLSYTRYSNDDVKKPSFTVDIVTYFVQFLNLSGLDRKLETEEE